MHLLAAQPGGISDGSEAVDLGQSPGDIVILSAADSELALIAGARAGLGPGFPTVRLANLMQLAHPMSVDLYVDSVIAEARLVIVRLLGGLGYWRYGVERVAQACRTRGIGLALVPGDDQPDFELEGFGTLPRDKAHRLWQYAVHGGAENARHLLLYAASLIGRTEGRAWEEPRPLLPAGLYWPGTPRPGLEDVRRHWCPQGPVAALTFYRALVQSGNLAPVDALIAALAAHGLNPLPLYVSSLKDPISAETVRHHLAAAPPSVVLNGTGFAVSSPGATRRASPLEAPGRPVLQVVFSGGTEAGWREGTRGLSARDLAMNVALPEVDGRILSRAVSFKAEDRRDPLTETTLVTYRPVPDRIGFVAALAAAWARLATTGPADRRIGLILANYPNKEGRLANGVGLDTPASAVGILQALADAGYRVDDAPANGNALIERLQAGPTNVPGVIDERVAGETLGLAEYRHFLDRLPAPVREAVVQRWGAPEADPFVREGAFRLAILRLGHVAVGIQPARGYNIDPKGSYHDPALVPPHAYLAFYAWLRHRFDVHAIVHLGKHGNLEWLPGKAVALSDGCFPEAALGPLPHLYPFIVNDPGEGSQAKRRAQAVIIDHLTPPLTRAESYGPLKDLEQLVDEYYEAAGVDPRRLGLLRDQILDLARSLGLDRDCGVVDDEEEASALAKLDNHLCELKELQIRDGLHVFGTSPDGDRATDLLLALARVPRGDGMHGNASLIRAVAADLGLEGFDPLDAALGDPWTGPRPAALEAALDEATPWRSQGDTVERLEILARRLVVGAVVTEAGWRATAAVLEAIDTAARPALEASGPAEHSALLHGLDGAFVEPGPSGAPTRGRLDVLPTGRNFYSVDSRTVPTPTAWQLGWQSAARLLDRHRQEHGEWPRSLALSAWGTANMRTGGDDLAQALALIGVRPTWDSASRRVTGFEVLPASVLDRPRVDVTLRVSGFFRDAFPQQIDLFDSAVRAVAALDEPESVNPLGARVRGDTEALVASGEDAATAARRAGYRVFGSRPGAYGAGLQALIDERGWDSEADLARAYLAWGGYAYGHGAEGAAEGRLFAHRLERIEAVVHNQDNREHDLLDSDDYYQFEGGLAVAVTHLSGERPVVYHNDHSRPERPVVRTLTEEIGRVVRGRAVNPKWISGVMRHGYKGAFEIAATVDYLFAFAATTGAVGDHHFDAVYDAYIGDDTVRGFMAENNPAALKETAERLLEAQDRGLWRPRSNAAYNSLRRLQEGARE